MTGTNTGDIFIISNNFVINFQLHKVTMCLLHLDNIFFKSAYFKSIGGELQKMQSAGHNTIFNKFSEVWQ
jgi:hypothetical protein